MAGGELSAPYLGGVALDAWDESGKPVRGEVGELVITKPLPSMPVAFWNDPDGTRYREAYFEMFPPGVWRHGGLDHHHRSRQHHRARPIRFDAESARDPDGQCRYLPVGGTAAGDRRALVIGAEQPDGGYWMPLFVVLADGVQLDDALVDKVKQTIRSQVSPPRHVPDEIIVAPGIPHTRTGKKLEVPIKKLFQGADPERVVERSAVDDPALLDWYVTQRRT